MGNLEKSGSVGRPTNPDFSRLFLSSPDLLLVDIMDKSSNTETESGRRGRAAGIKNYKNDVLIPIIERLLPQGTEGWRQVATAYHSASRESDVRDAEALRDNWVKKLCNNFKKPTGRTGENGDRIARCIAIERRIQDAANAAILGVSSAESDHDNEENEDDDVDLSEFRRHLQPPQMTITSTPSEMSGVTEGVDEELENYFDTAGNNNEMEGIGNDRAATVAAAATVSDQSPAAIVAVATGGTAFAAGGTAGGTAVPRRSPPPAGSRLMPSSKTKNSTNRERGLMGKALHRACDMFAKDGEDGTMAAMLSMQMQQQSQNQFMQQQMFQQQMQQQLSAMEKRAEATKKILKRIAKNTSRKGKKRAKTGGRSGSGSSSSSDDE